MKRIAQVVLQVLFALAFIITVKAAPPELFGTSLIADIAERVSPAVVAIESIHYVRARSRGGFGDPVLDRLFGHLFEDDFTGFNNVIPQRGNGSGVLISPEGHLLTNEHVISGADEILVKLRPDKSYKARVIGKDMRTDLAVLKIDADEVLPHVPIGDSSGIRVGEWVVAIGNPFGLGITVTTGVISAVHRDLSVDRERSYKDLIQTDASINPGNSGGALLNTSGELIGINTAIIPYGQGIGFAIPVNLAKRIVGDLMAYGRVKKAFLGATVQSITPELARYFEIPREGVLVTDVVRDSPAQKAGLAPGDVITEIQGRKVSGIDDFNEILDERRVGEKGQIKILRKGKAGVCEIEFNENPASKNLLGVMAKKVDSELSQKFSLFVDQGVVITMVAPDSPAGKAGLRAGDVLQQINRVPTLSEKAFDDAVAQLQSDSQAVLRVVRGQTVNLLLVNIE
ncbi:MAG: trypsin-like peptidase domain-containing protein [Candidatus Riflebacteria bacterium]|nr:trypsin-like peptidase domain-containing protein [Candidatus Riflebacteria bacterium]